METAEAGAKAAARIAPSATMSFRLPCNDTRPPNCGGAAVSDAYIKKL
jgi:hypothetical protein